jgi:Tol biopolymer transport system component
VSGSFEIWTMKQNGSQQSQVTHLGGRALFPDFSRDGTRIAFAGTVGDDPNNEIYTVDATSGTGLVSLTSCAGLAAGCYNDYPAWSPDGRQIVFIHADDFDADENPVNEQVWVMDVDGSDPHQLTTDSPPKDQLPDWSPDGSKIAYASGVSGIWVMNADGSNQHQLTGCGPGDPSPCPTGDDFGPAWSPDGTQIAFVRAFRALGSNDRPIFIMNADGTNQHRVIADQILQAVPGWQARGPEQGD